jgi:cysteine desulfurase
MRAMLPYFREQFGNPSSIHSFGQQAEAAVEDARDTVAEGLNSKGNEIVFTAGGSESDNLAIRGAAIAARELRGANHILISPVEHHAISHTAEQLKQYYGFNLEYIPVDGYGMVNPNDVAMRITPDTAVVSVIYANNEVGTLNSISEIGKFCRQRNIPFHTDAVQVTAYLAIDVEALQVDLLSIGAHKFYGPKGIGALYIRDGTPIISAQTGGGQETGLRAGTHNVPYIVGLAAALKIAQEEREKRVSHLLPLRNYLIEETLELIPDARLTGHPIERLPNHASFVFKEVDGNNLLMLLDVEGFSCSSGSACRTGDPLPSNVLTAMDISSEWALGSLRVTLGTHTTFNELESFLRVLPEAVERCREQITR